MEIEIRDKAPKAYYDELVYLMTNSEKVRSNPYRKAFTETSYLLAHVIGYIAVTMVALSLYFGKNDIIYLLIAGVLVFCVIFVLQSYIRSVGKMKALMNADGRRTVIIDGDGVRSVKGGSATALKWGDVFGIVINKRSIAVLPKDDSTGLIGLPFEYRDRVLTAVRAAEHFYLVTDNTVKD